MVGWLAGLLVLSFEPAGDAEVGDPPAEIEERNSPGIVLPGAPPEGKPDDSAEASDDAELESEIPAGFGPREAEEEPGAEDAFIDQPSVDREDHGKGTRPDWAKPRRAAYPALRTRLGITAGPNTLGAGIGAAYFVVPPVGIGLEIEDFAVFDEYGTFNVFELTPIVWLMVLPRRVVTPFLRAGFGGEFISRQLGSYGRWVAGTGLLIRIRRRWSIEAGVDVDGRVPQERWVNNLECGPFGTGGCSIFLVPRLGFGAAFDTM